MRGLDAELVPIINEFYGETVTVAGLLVGGDICGAPHSNGHLTRT